ncbi:response regulator [Geothrix sp. PMB-07]|uniref:response regulator n=1 Tax=Geothrix sp. PMB-07 TaxID=3068640 RepID=UPI002741EB1D|nr:response regulator [Geothrix sp. PMB-07]WLT30669.1 response regulator [Geothrix sp. PMB-07]
MTKVLIIDDSQMMRLYLRRCLEKGGYEVEDWMPLSAMEIPDRLRDTAPDLVLTDYAMTGCNGATVARMAHKAAPDLPVVVLTAFTDEDMEANLLRLGARAVLHKPITPEQLNQAIQEVLERSAEEVGA